MDFQAEPVHMEAPAGNDFAGTAQMMELPASDGPTQDNCKGIEVVEVEEFGGYDLDFVSTPPDTLICLVCFCVAKSPRQHESCGRIFCDSCLERHQRELNICPNCREEDPHYFKDTRGDEFKGRGT